MSSMVRAKLFIVGRDGNGKTSTCRSILSKQTRDQLDKFIYINDTLAIGIGTRKSENFEVTAIDGKCVGDTEPDLPSTSLLVAAIRKAIPPEGITAFVFVMKYGTRYTKQEKDAVDKIKRLFGEDVFRKWGVLVFTHGDNFDLDHEDEKMDFDAWCKEQQGDIASLFVECGHRYVLFNNKSQDKQGMVLKLMGKVKLLRDGPYFGGGLCSKSYTTSVVEFLRKHSVLCASSISLLALSLPLRNTIWRYAKAANTKTILAVFVINAMFLWPARSSILKMSSTTDKHLAKSTSVIEDSDKEDNSNNDHKEYIRCLLNKHKRTIIVVGIGVIVAYSCIKGNWFRSRLP
ncbi:uncharacterized protein LOC131938117 [Physella acuta]|uniref:uncharacterized protein LOC131938117 n=1 Tax=Physella acuta TaxID=109671 RepID=UPI0027DAEC0C|nr:uncharacterized protein LOC131938117 [Physella acuta]